MSQIFKASGGSSPIPPTVPTAFPTDSGTAIPAANILNVVTPGGGTQGIMTTGSGNTITIQLTEPIFSGTATTVGATTANISTTVPIAANSAASLIVNICGYSADNLCLGGESIGLIRNVAGTLTVVGTSDVTRNNDSALAAWNVTVVASGTNAVIQVTGVAGKTINWRADIEVCSAP